MTDDMSVLKAERSVDSLVGQTAGLTTNWSAVSTTVTVLDY